MFRSLAALIAGSAALFLSFGCSSSEKKHAEAEVKGKVTLDRKPLVEGTISFITPGFPADVLDIKNGEFSGKARVGEKRRVEINAYKDGPLEKNPMSDEMIKTRVSIVANVWNTNSTLLATITEGGDNTFHYDVTSAK